MKRNTLSHPQLFKLWEWIKKNHKRFQEENKPFTEVAPEATAALGFEITQFHIKAAAATLGLKWHGGQGNSAKKKSSTRYFKALAEELLALHASLGSTPKDAATLTEITLL